MGWSRPTELELTPEQLGALDTPFRQSLFAAFQAYGPISVTDAATVIHRAPKSTYYQVRILERAGLIVRCGEQGEGRKREALYDACADRVSLREDRLDAVYRQTIGRMVRVSLARTSRAYEAANSERDGTEESRLPLFVLSYTAKLTDEDIRVVQGFLKQAVDYAREKNRADMGTEIQVSVVTTPV
jgi:hypothetical protein